MPFQRSVWGQSISREKAIERNHIPGYISLTVVVGQQQSPEHGGNGYRIFCHDTPGQDVMRKTGERPEMDVFRGAGRKKDEKKLKTGRKNACNSSGHAL